MMQEDNRWDERWLSDQGELAASAARAAGETLARRGLATVADLERDVKSEGDLVAHQTILSILAASGIEILSEEAESAVESAMAGSLRWIVDPLDGTVNYTLGNPMACASIGLWDGETPLLGVVYDFSRDELWYGGPGLRSTCNGEPIRVSPVAEAKRAVIGTGFPSGNVYRDEGLRAFAYSVGKYKKVRLLGSAALSLCWVARGWLDCYREDGIYLWDVAAGIPIVLGAGGVARWRSSNARFPKGLAMAAGSEKLMGELIS